MSQVTQVIVFLTTVADLCLLAFAISVIYKMCRASRRLAQEPPLLSSDEEDDKEFIGILERNREEREFDRRNDEEANMNPRQAFLQQI